MPLVTGTYLGPYEIVAPLGAGGMGEVYRARDTRLGRDVAVKVLPAAFASDPERMRRFEQEARAVAALNHPNVLSVFDTGTHEGVPYLVTELLEGESFREMLAQGPIPGRKAAEYARQIAGGLAAAHEKNIVHRDLKPENLFLTSGGTVKILDFGLAKMPVAPPPPASGDALTATIAAVTSPGLIMGTSGYMAPEQVRGETVDHRADIFSFGATLYEMLTGRRAFQGETQVETLSAILKHEPPDVESEKLHVAPGLERIVRHCLEKKPADRFQSARDLMFALGAMSDSTTTTRVEAPALPPRRHWQLIAVIAVLALVAVLVGGIAYWLTRPPGSAERAQFAIAVPGEVSHLAITADGKWLAFVSPGETGSSPMVYVQRIGSAEAHAIPGTEGASYPFWSPDNAWVGFFANGKLRKVPVSGGTPQNLAPAGAGRGGSWNRKGVILFTREATGPLWRVNADGRGLARATEIARSKSQSHRWPFFLPDGNRFLMFASDFSGDEGSDTIHLMSLSARTDVVLTRAPSSAVYAAGRIYYVDTNGALVSAPLDAGAGKIGAPQMVAAKVARSPSTFYATFAVAENSTLVYSAASMANHSQLTWVDEAGKELGRVGPVGVLANPSISPDGKRVAFDSNDFKANNVDVWIFDFLRGTGSRFTFDPSEDASPAWSRDGATIAYRAVRDGRATVHVRRANGSEAAKPLAVVGDGQGDTIPNSWAPGNREILCTTNLGLVLLPDDGGKARPFLGASATTGQISPDGKWVAYASNETGDWEIYVTTFPAAAGKWQVSRGGGTEPRWRADGNAIFYIGPRQMLTETAVGTGEAFSADAPRELFPIHARAPISSTDLYTYDVASDGKRFLVNQYVRPEQAPPLTIVLH